MFQSVLICTDLADGLERLVHFVPSLAAAGLNKIVFLHCVHIKETGVIPRIDTEGIQQARAKLEVAQNNVPDGVSVVVEVECGRIADVILKTADKHDVGLMMLGYPIQSTFSEQLFGSTAVEIYDKTAVPILSIRPQLISTFTTEELDLRCRHLFRHLMIPYDGSETAKFVVSQVKQRVVNLPQRVLEACNVSWVLDNVERRDIPQEPFIQEAQTQLNQVKADLAGLSLKVEIEVLFGSAVVEVLKACLKPDISAIAVSRSPRRQFLMRAVPSFTQQLLHHSWHPTIYFPMK